MSRWVWIATPSGALAPHALGYEQWLREVRGFGHGALNVRLWHFRHLSLWLEREGFGAQELTPECGDRYVAARRAAGYSTFVSRLSLRLPLSYLREAGVAPLPVPADGPVERLLGDYRRYLVHERGLATQTVAKSERAARVFLEERERAGGLQLEHMTAADVSSFLARQCPRLSVSEARLLAQGLRSLLRYLHVAGLIPVSLRWAVPAVADLRDRTLARGLDPAHVAKLLASCDRRRTVGLRDYAVLLLLLRLGLRAGEVAAIELDDIDWRRGEILVRGKGGRLDRMPLPADVGDAVARYLRRRARSTSRALFLLVHAPRGPINGKVVLNIVHEACRRAALPRVGPHRLRHTAATEMLRAGASLPEIAQVLRHRELRTTAIYAKVDRSRLRALALPWPGGAA